MTDPQNPYRPANNDAPVPPGAAQSGAQQPGTQQPFNYAPAPEHSAQGQQPQGQQWAAPAAPAGPSRPSIWAAFGPGRNGFGVVSLLAVVVALVLSSILQLATAALVVSNGYSVLSLTNGIGAALSTVLSLTALVFGVMGLLSRNPSKWPAIAGTAVGASVFVSMLVNFAVSAVYTAF